MEVTDRLTTRASLGFAFRTVRGVLPRNLPGVLKISATLLLSGQFTLSRVVSGRPGRPWTDIWFSLKISAMCSFSHSSSLRAEKLNSSISSWAMFWAEDLSSATQGAEPTCKRAARGPAIAVSQTRLNTGKTCRAARRDA
jgi:hypothetical protein